MTQAKEILIADDDASLCRILTVHCRHMGLRVRMAHDAMHGLILIHRQKPDLVLMDINMPAGNGLSVCEMLTTDARLCDIPVIIMSGSAKASDITRCHAMGAQFVFKQPHYWEELKPLISELLKLKEMPKRKCA